MVEQRPHRAEDLKLLGTLGSVLPALETLDVREPAYSPDGVQQLAEGLGAGGTANSRGVKCETSFVLIDRTSNQNQQNLGKPAQL